jgi:hypothetical protein
MAYNFQELNTYFSTELNTNVKEVRKFMLLRLFSFLVFSLCVYLCWTDTLFIIPSCITFVAFLWTVSQHQDAKRKRNANKMILSRIESEKNHDFVQFENQEDYQSLEPQLSLDLDLFGEGSVFSMLNRTYFQSSKDRIAKQLVLGLQKTDRDSFRDKVKQYQSKQQLNLAVWGIINASEIEPKIIDRIKEEIVEPKRKTALPKWTQFLSLSIVGSLFTIYQLEYIPISFLSLGVMVIFGLNLLKYKNLNQSLTFLKKSDDFLSLTKLVLEIDKLIKQNDIESIFDEKQTKTISELKKLLERYNRLSNSIGHFVVATLFWEDLYLSQQLNNWFSENADSLKSVLKRISDFEIEMSVANFNNLLPNSCEPKEEGESYVSIKEMGHPLMLEEKIVKNSFDSLKEGHFVILTGANMAGKSTFLRGLGVNYMLAMAGTNVYAEYMTFKRAEIMTGMRIVDSLQDNASFFYAELKNLQRIIRAKKEGKDVFILLDEILKGTNSYDKETGSKAYIENLVSLGANGIIATHDLSITVLEKEISSIRNYCFESIYNGQDLTFDYTLNNGVCQNMNASILMEQMELIRKI